MFHTVLGLASTFFALSTSKRGALSKEQQGPPSVIKDYSISHACKVAALLTDL